LKPEAINLMITIEKVLSSIWRQLHEDNVVLRFLCVYYQLVLKYYHFK